MPRFFKKHIARRPVKGRKPARRPARGRKLLVGGLGLPFAKSPYYSTVRKYGTAEELSAFKKSNRRYKRVRQESLMLSDNIATLPATVIGKRKPLTFDEKVSRVERPPILFKRNYEFSAEGTSGRKAWFSFEFNKMVSDDLNADLTTYKLQQYTDTATADATVPVNSVTDGSKFYVDYLSEKLSLINSSSNSLIGKIHLFAHKRDTSNAYNSTVPITPINLMMYYSTNRLPLQTTANEAVVNNGWKFDTVTSSYNYNAVYQMPGSSLNATGVTAWTDTMLSPSSPHIKDSMDFWFRKVNTFSFNLKPGQQVNKTYTFHDLKDIMREE